MSDAVKIAFGPLAAPSGGGLVAFTDGDLKTGPATEAALAAAGDLLTRAAAADHFTGKSGSVLDIVAPPGLRASRLVVIGTGKAEELKPQDFTKFGGIVIGRVPKAATEATVL